MKALYLRWEIECLCAMLCSIFIKRKAWWNYFTWLLIKCKGSRFSCQWQEVSIRKNAMKTMEPLRIVNGITSLGGCAWTLTRPSASVFPHLCGRCPLPVTSSPWFTFCLLEVKLTSTSVNSAVWFKMRTRVSLLLVPVLSSNEFWAGCDIEIIGTLHLIIRRKTLKGVVHGLEEWFGRSKLTDAK